MWDMFSVLYLARKSYVFDFQKWVELFELFIKVVAGSRAVVCGFCNRLSECFSLKHALVVSQN